MNVEKFQIYLEHMQEMVSKRIANPALQKEIIARIESESQNSEPDPHSEAFFQAELLFHSGQYEQSLKHYLAAKGIPFFQFFCYRASSAIAHNRGQNERALSFAEKAAMLWKGDPIIEGILNLQQASPTATALVVETPSVTPSSIPPSSISSSNIPKEPLAHVEQSTAKPKLIFEQPRNSHPQQPEETCPLALAIESFKTQEQLLTNAYLERTHNQNNLPSNYLCSLTGWNFTPSGDISDIAPLLLVESTRQHSGGHYLRWHGKGIVINPGRGFMHNFHAHGLCVRDIDFVIVTKDTEEAHEDIRAIYDLNQHLNKCASELQIIHYYLHQQTFQKLATALKPSFKQARNTIHNLEIFVDSPEVETIELTSLISLHYFLACSSPHTTKAEDTRCKTNLGLKLELSSNTGIETFELAYLSGMGWSPVIAQHLGSCDLLLAAFGNTDLKDLARQAYTDQALGFHGCATLISEIAPRLMLLTEFGGREGDIRLEATKKLRNEVPAADTTIMPADIGMVIDLDDITIQCSLSKTYNPATHTHVTSSRSQFGRLQYLSEKYCL
jgi:tetratricopeptide (TPR) repeat protein